MHELIINIAILVGWALVIKKFINDAKESVFSHYDRAIEQLDHRIRSAEWDQSFKIGESNEILKRIEAELKILNSDKNGYPMFPSKPLSLEEINASMRLWDQKKKERGDDI